jgi:cation transport ATPase
MACAAPIAAPWGILLTPAVGAVLMSASTVIVAINARLLGRGRDADQAMQDQEVAHVG